MTFGKLYNIVSVYFLRLLTINKTMAIGTNYIIVNIHYVIIYIILIHEYTHLYIT